MDRRQRKTREGIFDAFTSLLAKKDFSQITVSEIIEKADVGRATFYAHFETKEHLLQALCEDLFCHIFDVIAPCENHHKHIFAGECPEAVFVHLLTHLQRNDNNILSLLTCASSEVFLQYFKQGLQKLVISQLPMFEARKSPRLPDSLWVSHIASTFVETVRWWLNHGMQESPETIAEYFYLTV